MRVGIAGATGYTGLLLLQLLLKHPHVAVEKLFSSSAAGTPISDHFSGLVGACDVVLSNFIPADAAKGLDVLFLALPHGESHKWMGALTSGNPECVVIDLSADFRLRNADDCDHYYGFSHGPESSVLSAVMGIPELYRRELSGATLIANPGCYAVTSILGLMPISDAIGNAQVVIDAKSGVSGAGRSLSRGNLYCETNESTSAYKTGTHRHHAEIVQEAGVSSLLFSPHLVPQSRGIISSIYVENRPGYSEASLQELYASYYNDEPFVRVATGNRSPSTRDAVGSNLCVITPMVRDGMIVVFSCTDNLLKGAAGIAVQNMNIALGFDESAGLTAMPGIL